MCLGRGLRRPDEQQQQDGADIARGIEDDRDRGAYELGEETRDAGSDEAGGRHRHLELRVALDQPIALDNAGQVRLVGHVEEDLEAADREGDDVQLPEREPAGQERHRDRRKQHRAPDVGADQDRPAPHAVDPHPGGDGEQDEGQELQHGEQAELERRDLEGERGHERYCELGDLVAELADGLAGPQLHELAVAPE